MLLELSIKHFAIIDDLRIRFSKGLTILTGETGAGKSIIINAVNLLLGRRADARLIRTGYDSAELEALFEIDDSSHTAKIMRENGFDPEEGLLIRRLISHHNRHRIYINGRLSTIQMLKDISENLASISGQHAHQGLLQPDQQLLILDQFGGLSGRRNEVGESYRALQPLIRRLDDLNLRQQRQAERIDLLEYQKKEIEQAEVTPGEDRMLEKERTRLKHADLLSRTIHAGIEALYAGEGAIVERLGTVQKDIEKASEMDASLEEASGQLADAIYRLEDITAKLRDYTTGIFHDDGPGLLEETEARLDTLNRLKRKYGGSLEAVIAHHDDIGRELSELETLDARIRETEASLTRGHRQLAEKATKLSDQRKKAAQRLARKVENELASLEMPQTRFEVRIESIPCGGSPSAYLTANGSPITESGMDQVEFMIAPNPGEALKPLARIASGGELSRMVLALKAILATKASLETVIFDEVDTGIGGGTAEMVGKKIASLAGFHQIICITHQPQIAKFGDHHFKISKNVSDGSTRTHIVELGPQERIQEIARMLGGIEITPATLEHAREMIEHHRCADVVHRPLLDKKP